MARSPAHAQQGRKSIWYGCSGVHWLKKLFGEVVIPSASRHHSVKYKAGVPAQSSGWAVLQVVPAGVTRHGGSSLLRRKHAIRQHEP